MRIGIIAPYPEMLDMAKQLVLPNGVELLTAVATYDEAVLHLREMEKEGVEAIITRGATQYVIEANTTIPVIGCNASVGDLIPAICEAKQYSNKIAINSYSDFLFIQDSLEKAFDIELTCLDGYVSKAENYAHVKSIKGKGVFVVLGGSVTMEAASHFGVKGVLIPTSLKTLDDSIHEAIRVANALRKERASINHIEQVVEFTTTAIYWMNMQGKLSAMNTPAVEFLNKLGYENTNTSININIFGETIKESLLKSENVIRNVATEKGITFIYTIRSVVLDNQESGLMIFIEDSSEIQKKEYDIRFYRNDQQVSTRYNIHHFIGVSKEAERCRNTAKLYAACDSTVLLTGESGTGKEILAQGIHSLSDRSNHPFIAVNCNAIEQNLLESELFGYEEGSFTGAKKGGKIGLIELAHKGTIFLDEIGDIPISTQVKLLRTIQEKEVRRIGSETAIPVDVRFITATNADLPKEVREGRFRLDLYYRLNVLELNIVPLRKRKQDILPTLQQYCEDFNLPISTFTEADLERIMKYNWPGNARELRNFVERTSTLRNVIPVNIILDEFFDRGNAILSTAEDTSDSLKIKIGNLEDMENDIIYQLYNKNPNKTALANMLGISRATLWKKLEGK